MTASLQKTFNFSEPFLSAEYIENAQDFEIKGKTVVVNADDTEIVIEGKPLRPWNSSIYSSLVIPRANRLVCITLDTDFFSFDPYPHVDIIKGKWTHVYEIFSLPHLKNTELLRSEKERIGNVEFNLWYAAKGTNCGIHKKHSFRELHTQVFGIGRMQKFHQNNYDSIFQDVFMSPGYTHEAFYGQGCAYPWHQYWADTDCIWLAIEFYGE